MRQLHTAGPLGEGAKRNGSGGNGHAAPAKASTVWGELIESLPSPAELSWEVRRYLLPRFVRFKQQQAAPGLEAALAAWLDVPADRIGELLGLELTRGCQLAAARACLLLAGATTATLFWWAAQFIGR
jgi:hypothetical protein